MISINNSNNNNNLIENKKNNNDEKFPLNLNNENIIKQIYFLTKNDNFIFHNRGY